MSQQLARGIYFLGLQMTTYCLTKNSGTMLLQQIGQDVPSSKMRIINYYSGYIEIDIVKSDMRGNKTSGVITWDSR